MRLAVAKFVENCSTGHFPLDKSITDAWLNVLRDCLASADVAVQQSAAKSATALINQYYANQSPEVLSSVLERFIVDISANSQQSRIGNALALGLLPKFILKNHVPDVIHHLCLSASITENTLQWAESRKSSIAALAQVCLTVGVSESGKTICKGIYRNRTQCKDFTRI